MYPCSVTLSNNYETKIFQTYREIDCFVCPVCKNQVQMQPIFDGIDVYKCSECNNRFTMNMR